MRPARVGRARPNLLDMTTRKIRPEDDRRRIVAEFARAGLSQSAYAQQHGISARTLRTWMRLYGTKAHLDPGAEFERIVERAITDLQALLAAVRKRAEVRPEEVEGTASTTGEVRTASSSERKSEPEAGGPLNQDASCQSGTSPVRGSPRPLPMPPPGLPSLF